ncbi:cytidylate kinase [Dissulfurispira thermophila]|uniref:Cytidylate kinase n=1 Tax=Dissulfurispira thermophila TaxID=2715679 RepID=A0A7G1GYU1_9BACT|nr:(d)CMP kinase [Dissulfurispira thermophila]BCB95388.1 cytidylate kinase [Dissulfurispira thermophila]
MGKVIAIDGPSGAGKSTLSKLIAERLGFQFLDTGALYRATALHLMRNGLKEDSTDEEIASALKGVEIVFIDEKVFLKDTSRSYEEDVSEQIRTTDIGHYASVFSAKKVVRDFLLQKQRDAAIENNIVAEGRDMTTVVFPHAWRKFFLDASEQGRAKRRYLQLKEKGIDITMEDALRDIQERDRRDSNRDIAPLKRADDAIYIDTTDMSMDEVLERMLEAIGN